jgi:hypothetical protein
LLCRCGRGGVLLSLGDFRAPTFSLSVTRGDVGLEDEFEWFMQLLATYFYWLRCSCRHMPPDLKNIGYQHRHFYRAAGYMQEHCSDYTSHCTQYYGEYRKMRRLVVHEFREQAK